MTKVWEQQGKERGSAGEWEEGTVLGYSSRDMASVLKKQPKCKKKNKPKS